VDDLLAQAIEAQRMATIAPPPIGRILAHNHMKHGPKTHQGAKGAISFGEAHAARLGALTTLPGAGTSACARTRRARPGW
jgi:hypothetical protein